MADTPDTVEHEAPDPEVANLEVPDPDDVDDPVTEEPTGADAPAAPLSDAEQALLARLEAELGDAILDHGVIGQGVQSSLVVRVRPDAWRRSAEVCKRDLGCDYLSFVSAIDWMPAPSASEEGSGDTSSPVQPTEMTYGVAGSTGRMQVFAHVESTSDPRALTLKVDLDDAEPRAESWVSVYPGADWHERETWEMYGISFDGHPSLRHLYLPSEFEGHPGRKDFPLLAREVKPWPGLVDVEPMPAEPAAPDAGAPESREGGETTA